MTKEHTSFDVTSRLRDLPDHAEAPYDWSEFKHRSHERRGAHWHRTAIAASVVLVLAGIAGWMRYSADDGLGQMGDSSFEGPMLAVGGAAIGGEAGATSGVPGATHLDTQSATVAWLENLPSEPAIVRVSNRLPVVDLEDRIALVDDMLNAAQVESAQPAHIQSLRRERAQLISSLARVRYAETLAAER
jgi:hypothetical protein